MRLFIFILTMSFATSVFADTVWVKKSAVKNHSRAFSKKESCERIEKEKCFSVANKDMRRFKLGFRGINIVKTQDCLNSADCQSQIDNQQFACDSSNDEVPSFDDKANWPALDFAAQSRPDTGFFLWCQKETLVADSAGSAAADSEDSAKAAEKAKRETKRGNRDTALKQCVRVALKGVADLPPATATTNQLANRQNKLKDCLGLIIKEVMATRLDEADL